VYWCEGVWRCFIVFFDFIGMKSRFESFSRYASAVLLLELPMWLLRVVRFTQVFEEHCFCLSAGTSVTGELVKLREFLPTLPKDEPVVYCFGAQAHGVAEIDWADKYLSVSNFPLSGACALGRLTNAYEEFFDIL